MHMFSRWCGFGVHCWACSPFSKWHQKRVFWGLRFMAFQSVISSSLSRAGLTLLRMLKHSWPWWGTAGTPQPHDLCSARSHFAYQTCNGFSLLRVSSSLSCSPPSFISLWWRNENWLCRHPIGCFGQLRAIICFFLSDQKAWYFSSDPLETRISHRLL